MTKPLWASSFLIYKMAMLTPTSVLFLRVNQVINTNWQVIFDFSGVVMALSFMYF